MVASIVEGTTVLRNCSTRARAALATSTAFWPGFLVTVSVTAGWPALPSCPAGVYQT